jgi:hypothetical protein
MQLPPLQVPPSQTCPQFPQLLGSLIVSTVVQLLLTQQPFGHEVDVHWQVPPLHCCMLAHA